MQWNLDAPNFPYKWVSEEKYVYKATQKVLVMPVYNRDESENPETSRPSSITGALLKLIENLLGKQIKAIDNENCLSNVSICLVAIANWFES